MDIWVHDLKTKAERRLSTLPNADTAPAFSPDGKSISFISSADFEQSETYIVLAEGGEPRKIMDRTFGVGYPSWSPDSRFVDHALVQAASRPAIAKG